MDLFTPRTYGLTLIVALRIREKKSMSTRRFVRNMWYGVTANVTVNLVIFIPVYSKLIQVNRHP